MTTESVALTLNCNPFERMAAINVNSHTEKKGELTYLSWAWAVDQLLRADPFANWTYGEPAAYGGTMMVFCTVTAFGIARTMQLPVMDYRNKAVSNPDAFQVNTAMQRCLVKAIALHGLGLYIYAGEDLPEGEAPKDETLAKVGASKERPNTPTQVAVDAFDALSDEMKDYIAAHAKTIIALHSTGGDMAGYIAAQEYDTEAKLALWSKLPSNVRSAIKKQTQPALAEQG